MDSLLVRPRIFPVVGCFPSTDGYRPRILTSRRVCRRFSCGKRLFASVFAVGQECDVNVELEPEGREFLCGYRV